MSFTPSSTPRGRQSVRDFYRRMAIKYSRELRQSLENNFRTEDLTVNDDFLVNGPTTLNGELDINNDTTMNGNVDVSGNIDVTGGIFSNGNLLLPPATILPFAGSTAPGGYLLCDGSSVSRTTYSDLFATIGTTYGVGDGSTTFNLPNLSGRMILGVSGGHALATTGGAETQILTQNELPSHSHTGTTNDGGSHTHTINDPGHVHARLNARDDGNSSNTPGQAPAGDANTNYTTGYPTESATTGITINSVGDHTHSFTTNSTGSGSSFSIMNPFLSLNYIIKI